MNSLEFFILTESTSISTRENILDLNFRFFLMLCDLQLTFNFFCEYSQTMLFSFSVPMSETQAAKGGQARMTCDISPTVPGDRAQLVIWYKDGASTPIYRYLLFTNDVIIICMTILYIN